jgi:hypothetical protein
MVIARMRNLFLFAALLAAIGLLAFGLVVANVWIVAVGGVLFLASAIAWVFWGTFANKPRDGEHAPELNTNIWRQ